jgi:hypothetical protein
VNDGKNLLTLSGVSLPYEDLPFYADAQVGTTDSEGVTELSTGEFTFYISATSMKYRKKVKGSGAASPMKEITSFEQLKNLGIGEVSSVPSPQEEKTNMAMKVNVEGKQFDVPANVEAILRKAGKDKDAIELADFDEVLGSANGKNLEVLSGFETELSKMVEGPAADADADKAGDQAPAAPAAGGLGGGTIGGSNVFSGGNRVAPTTRVAKTDAEKEAERIQREAEKQEVLSRLKESSGTIENLRKQVGGHELAQEAIRALQRLVVVDGHIPAFKTLVNADTRLRADVRNNVKPEDRVYHSSLRGKPGYTATGKDIKPKYAQGDYDVELKESNPSSPSGIFLYLPEALKDFMPSKFSQFSEREKVTSAAEQGNETRVIRYLAKTEVVQLLLLTGADIVFWNGQTRKYIPGSPTIYLSAKANAETEVTTYSLRAMTSNGKNTKLSVRHFVPLNTYNTVRVGSPQFNAKNTTHALFHRLLMNIPEGAPANKFSQLSQAGKVLFTQEPDGSIIYNGFQDSFQVGAYDNVGDSNQTTTLGCPLVVMSNPTTAGAVSKPVFSKSRHTEAGYSAAHKKDLELVQGELKSVKRVTNRSSLNTNQAEIAKLEGINKLLSAEGITIK